MGEVGETPNPSVAQNGETKIALEQVCLMWLNEEITGAYYKAMEAEPGNRGQQNDELAGQFSSPEEVIASLKDPNLHTLVVREGEAVVAGITFKVDPKYPSHAMLDFWDVGGNHYGLRGLLLFREAAAWLPGLTLVKARVPKNNQSYRRTYKQAGFAEYEAEEYVEYYLELANLDKTTQEL
jgi:hypothetical protein